MVAIVFGLLAIFSSGSSIQRLLQVLITAQASILAIIVSVWLLSVQVSISQFTPLIARHYQKSGFLDKGAYVFGLSMFASMTSILLLPLVDGEQGHLMTVILMNESYGATIDTSIAFKGILTAIPLGMASLAFSTVLKAKDRAAKSLTPEHALSELAESVSATDYKKYLQISNLNYPPTPEDVKEGQRNPLLEIYETGRRAIKENDVYRAEQSIVAFDIVTRTIVSELSEEGQDLSSSASSQIAYKTSVDATPQNPLFQYWREYIKLATVEGAEDVLAKCADTLRNFTNWALEKGYCSTASISIETLTIIFPNVEHNDIDIKTEHLDYMNEIMTNAVTEDCYEGVLSGQTGLSALLYSLSYDAKQEEEVQDQYILSYVLQVLEAVWIATIEHRSENSDEIGEIIVAVDRGFIHCFGDYIGVCEDGNRPFEAETTINALQNIGTEAITHNINPIPPICARFLMELYIYTGDYIEEISSALREFESREGSNLSSHFEELRTKDYVYIEQFNDWKSLSEEERLNLHSDHEGQITESYLPKTRFPPINTVSEFQDRIDDIECNVYNI